MEVETRQAALCLIRRENSLLVAEIRDPQTGAILHRPPGGGVEGDESPEEAVRRCQGRSETGPLGRRKTRPDEFVGDRDWQGGWRLERRPAVRGADRV